MRALKVCPCTLEKSFETYSPKALERLFDGRKVSHIIDFCYKDNQEELTELFAEEHEKIYELIENSFLDKKTKHMYKKSYLERLSRFRR